MKKRALSLLLALVIVFSMVTPALADGGFINLTGDQVMLLVRTDSKAVLVYYNDDAQVAEIKSFASGSGVTVYGYKAGSEESDVFTTRFTGSIPCPCALMTDGLGGVSGGDLSLGTVMSLLQQAGLYDPAVNSVSTMTAADQAAYAKIIAMKARYPEGMHWTDANTYTWKAPIYMGGELLGGGCVGFAMIMSDAAFGEDIPAQDIKKGSFTYSDVHTGTILRVNGNTHTVIVLETYEDHVTVAEGNINSSIHWGRVLTKAEVMAADYITVRSGAPVTTQTPAQEEKPEAPAETEQPEETKKPDETEAPAEDQKPDEEKTPEETEKEPAASTVTFVDVDQDSYYADAVVWAVENNITNGNGTNAKGEDVFSPENICTRGQVVTFLWRTAGCPEPENTSAEFADLTQDWYKTAVAWAVENGITNGAGTNAKGEAIFDPNAECSGAHIATFIYRALFGEDASKGGDQWYSIASKWIEDNSFSADMDFSLTAGCSRADTVTFLYRYACMDMD